MFALQESRQEQTEKDLMSMALCYSLMLEARTPTLINTEQLTL